MYHDQTDVVQNFLILLHQPGIVARQYLLSIPLLNLCTGSKDPFDVFYSCLGPEIGPLEKILILFELLYIAHSLYCTLYNLPQKFLPVLFRLRIQCKGFSQKLYDCFDKFPIIFFQFLPHVISIKEIQLLYIRFYWGVSHFRDLKLNIR